MRKLMIGGCIVSQLVGCVANDETSTRPLATTSTSVGNIALGSAPSDTFQSSISAVDTKPRGLIAPTAVSVPAETVCSVRDLGPDGRGHRVVDREVYSFPKMTQQLVKYPALAQAVGLNEIHDCAGARQFADRYLHFREAHPDFDVDEHPSKAEVFKQFFSDPDNIDRSKFD